MTLFQTVAPQAEPITLAEVKKDLRIDHDSEDELLQGLIRAAREDVEATCGIALIAQHWRLCLDRVPASGRVLLRRHPVRAVTSVTVFGEEGEAALVDPADYVLDAYGRPARLHFRRKPEPGAAMNGIEIDFEAGFGEAGTDVPDLLKHALIRLVAHWYEFRATYSATDQPVSYPAAHARLIAPWRSRRL